MHHTATTTDGDLDDPTDHPNVHENTAPPLRDDVDEDETLYTIGFKGDMSSVRFLASVVLDRVPDDLYEHHERGPHGTFSLYEITEDDIDEAIEAFEDAVDSVDNIRIAGEIDGETHVLQG